MQQARGTFTVQMKPQSSGPAEGLSRFLLTKVIEGQLEGTSQGEMLSGGDPKKGTAGYVAIERVSGSLEGKQGSFALQHAATMDASGAHMSIVVVPGSGTGDLAGISGKFTIHVEGGTHSYDMEYTLP